MEGKIRTGVLRTRWHVLPCLLLFLVAVAKPSSARLWGNAFLNPKAPNGSFVQPGLGPCSRNRATVYISRLSDIARARQGYGPNDTVTLLFLRSLILRPGQGIVLDGNYSCTIISAAPKALVTISYPYSDMPALTVYNTSNIYISGISIVHGLGPRSKVCSFPLYKAGKESSTILCPVLYIVYSYGIQYTRANVRGRIDVFRSMFVKLDWLTATMPPFYTTKSLTGEWKTYNTHGVIRIGETSLIANLVPSNIVVSNCDIYGSWELISLYRGAVGVTVRNNYLHDFLFTGIRCGADVAYVMDCHLNSFVNNFILNPPAYTNSTSDINNAGIYLCVHWFNPGNYISCNYILNQRQCIYLDFASSGVTIDGGLCYNMYTGVKVNNGKYNTATSLIMYNTGRFFSFVSCVTVLWVNCFIDPGNNWEAMRRIFYNTRSMNKNYPYMSSICNPVTSSLNRTACNTVGGTSATANQTGYCSGLGYRNFVEVFGYYPPPVKGNIYEPQAYSGCDNVTAQAKLNTQRWHNITDNPGFRRPLGPGISGFDAGLLPTSRIYRNVTSFTSCQRATVGQQVVLPSEYMVDFNIAKPAWFEFMKSATFGAILNITLLRAVVPPPAHIAVSMQ